MVIDSPRLMSPSRVRHTSSPVSASSATVWLSRVLKKMRPSEYAAPRFTTSQQATPCGGALHRRLVLPPERCPRS